MKPIYVLGNGQLGNMLNEAGTRLGIHVQPMSIEESTPMPDDVIVTAEREHWQPTSFIQAIISHPGWINAETFECIPDRRKQKARLDAVSLPTSPWCVTTEETTLADLTSALGDRFLLKSARDGYDGKGQWRYHGESDATLPDWKANAIAEKFINFETEVSLVGARNAAGQCVFYELTENFHSDGILQLSLKLEGEFAAHQEEAETHLRALMEDLDYVGVMAAEFFLTSDGLLINEIAPRVHNSGHWTQAGASVSQFELHVRAVAGLPLPAINQSGNSMMINLIGEPFDDRWYTTPGARIHWYGKSLRPGRKLGHVNFHHTDRKALASWLSEAPLSERFEGSRQKAAKSLTRA